jgi:hypothetical protein
MTLSIMTPIKATLCIGTLSILALTIMIGEIVTNCSYVLMTCHYAERHYTQCHGALKSVMVDAEGGNPTT